MRWNAFALVVALIVSGCAPHDAPARGEHASGEEQARHDLAAGHLELRMYGLVVPQDAVFERLLQDRLGVQLTRVAGCAIGGQEMKQVDVYNRVMREEIDRRFGPGSIERLREEAARSMPAMQPAA